jgi:hypothetical protein
MSAWAELAYSPLLGQLAHERHALVGALGVMRAQAGALGLMRVPRTFRRLPRSVTRGLPWTGCRTPSDRRHF